MDIEKILFLINEELSNFDFLNNENSNEENGVIYLLNDRLLQKQFICDSLLLKKNKIKVIETSDAILGGNWEDNIDGNLTIEYHLKIEYLYDETKEPLVFNLDFDSDNIEVHKESDYNYGSKGSSIDNSISPSGGDWFNYFNWNAIKVTLSTIDNNDIEFIEYIKAPSDIKVLFIREYTESFIKSASLDIKTKEMNNNIQNISYC